VEPSSPKPVEMPLKKDRATQARGTRYRAPDRELEDRGAVLIQVELRMWTGIASDIRQHQLEVLDSRYHDILNELYNSANLCVERYKQFSNAHKYWRRTLIVGTGVLAIINLIASNKELQVYSHAISLSAAAFAVVLAILANLESFSNSLEKAQAFRESRDLFLDVAREFDRRWDIYVRPLGETPEACVNASELYRQVVAKDRDLRSKFKELTKIEAKTSSRK
jgi:hypothetical protein